MTMTRRTMIIAVLIAVAAFFGRDRGANAQISASPCTGNICTGSVIVGGQNVDFAFTEHITPNGTFKIRLNGGVYNTGSVISHMIYDMPAFADWDKYRNPEGDVFPPIFLPEENVNPTAYERRDSNGCLSCIVDQVMTVTYSGLAPGAYTFSLLIIQNGASGGFIDRTFYVDAAAPDTDDEAASLAGITPAFDPSCGDTSGGQPVDNDLDYFGNCADPSCDDQPATGLGPTPKCETPETTCSDDFDNDADGLKDCLDPDCDNQLGRVSPPAYCQINESLALLSGTTPCDDLFDNDGDGLKDCVDNISSPAGNPAQTCWKQTAYGCPATETSCTDGVDNDQDRSYDDSVANWDDQPSTGIDCMDYDCAGNAACPIVENKNAAGLDQDQQCFDTVDNDLDHQTDCADIDCRGVIEPPGTTGRVCFEKEFDLAQSYQRCNNAGFDDDGDGPADCDDDPDCKRRFGNCGPCPAREDFTYASCSDVQDNDTDAAADCADIDCIGNIGQPSTAAHCAALGGESGSVMCGDGFDNDVNGETDCADAACSGASICTVPDCSQTYACQPAGETGGIGCDDARDNDADGLIDCADDGCYAQGSCRAKGWTNAICQVVPDFGAEKTFTSSSPSVVATSYETVHVSASDVVRLTGTASYSSITIIIGDNTDPTKYYPYASNLGANCLLSGFNAGQFGATAVDGHAIQLFNISQPVNTFDVTLNCLTPAVPAAARNYPISISVQKEPGSVAEYGDADFATTLYEATLPTMIAVEGEGETFASSTLRVPYGNARRFRAVPSDPGAGLDQSGICRCTVNVGATPHASATGECVTDPVVFTNDASVTVSGLAEDGANNVGVEGGSRPMTINVVPSVKTPLVMTSPSKPYFRTGLADIGVSAEFQTGIPGSFGATCEVYVRNTAGTVVINGPVGPSMTFAGVTGGGNLLNCLSTITLPSMADGEYSMSIRATDVAGDEAETNKIPVFVCNSVPAYGAPETVCSKADLDRDGASDGLYTTLYSTSPKACDNCMGLVNGTQTDLNANGVGDQCEPDDAHGRCEVDTELVCDCDSNAVTCAGIRCPGPSIKKNALGVNINPQRCIQNWGLCTTGGSICLDSPGNPADEQCHFCDDDPAVGCSVDKDCEDAGLGAGATCGAFPANNGEGTCAGLPSVVCRRDSQCLDAGNNDAYVGPCENSNRCENLLFPWLQTEFGSIFSKKNIIAPAEPPENRFNATYCISAQGTIANFKSENCLLEPNAGTPFELPKPPSYANVFGRIDVPGLLAGKYGTVVNVTQTTFAATFNPNPLDGKVYVVDGDLAINAPIAIAHAVGAAKGNGTVIVKGGNLTVNADITYGVGGNPQGLANIGSIAWLVLPVINGDLSLSKGEIYINKNVRTVVGAFFAGGTEGIYTVLPSDIEGPEPLEVFGMMVARKFHLGRSYKSVSQGSERFIFDGRAVANPPPGLGDITKTLPLFSDTLPQ